MSGICKDVVGRVIGPDRLKRTNEAPTTRLSSRYPDALINDKIPGMLIIRYLNVLLAERTTADTKPPPIEQHGFTQIDCRLMQVCLSEAGFATSHRRAQMKAMPMVPVEQPAGDSRRIL